MLLTEDQAQTKWCPFVRQPQFVPSADSAVVGGCNSQHDGTHMPRHGCIGSACMAWRWAHGEYESMRLPHSEMPEGEGWEVSSPGAYDTVWKRERGASRQGFCGLAGGLE